MSGGALADPLIGCTFRGYRIERLLASGGMGAVYVASDESLPNVRKVVKVLLADPALDAARRAFVHDRFLREALTVSVLHHENIVKVHAVGTLDGTTQPCMLMDYVEGQTLHEYASTFGGRVPPYRVLPIMCHVARGLDAAHSLGIVHRDLKPANIILCPKDNDPAFCQLLDFGIAKLTRPLVGELVPTMGGVGIGTPSYMAVEQFKHADEATPLSDVYALAIVIWELVTGELPWGQPDTSTPVGIAMLYQLQRDAAPHAPLAGTLPPGWERTLRSALSPHPDERPASVRHLLVDLAVELESVGPHVRSGVDILRSIAPHFIAESSPDADTVRDAPPRTIAVAWPRRESSVRVAAADIPTRRELPRAPRTPAMPSGPSAPVAATTLGASNGALLQHPAMARRRRLAYLGITAAALATTAVVAVLSDGTQNARTLESLQPMPAAQPIMSAPTAPADTTPGGPTVPVQPPARPATVAPQPAERAPVLSSPVAVEPAPKTTPPQPKAVSKAVQPTRPATRSPGARAPRSTSTTTPVKTGAAAGPDRTKAHAPGSGSGRKFDPNAVGGREEE
jgi:serine/threonine-protein kinase